MKNKQKELKDWLKAVEEGAKNAEEAGQVRGACLLPDPNGGPPICIKVDSNTCQTLGGNFVGGDCVGD